MTIKNLSSTDLLMVLFSAAALLGTTALSCGPAEPSAPGFLVEAPDDGSLPEDDEPTGEEPAPDVVDEEPDDDGPPADQIECERDADCDDGEFCNGAELCGPRQRCVPGVFIECPAMLPLCDENKDTCVCTPASCGPGATCDGFACF